MVIHYLALPLAQPAWLPEGVWYFPSAHFSLSPPLSSMES